MGVTMFRKVSVPILGVIENMATFICPNCGAASAIFGRGLGHGELRITGAGGHVHDEHVEFAPGHVAQHLGDGRLHHRPATVPPCPSFWGCPASRG
jgi:hypothetical protein